MMNHQTQGPNQMESPGNLLQQQPPNFDVQVSKTYGRVLHTYMYTYMYIQL